MKLKTMCVVSILLMICFSGCSNKNESISKTNDMQTNSISDLSVNIDKVNETFDSFPNLKTSDNIRINTPNNLTEVFKYTTKTPINVNMKNYYNEFIAMFEYLFPNHKLDENYLLYVGGSSDLVYDDNGGITQNFNKVSDWYDKIISGSEGRVYFLYDETWYLDMTEWKAPVCLELGNPIGYGYTVINKGRTVELNNKKVYDDLLKAERYPRLESYDPADYLEYVETYSPDSTKSFKLADKEMPINEAVDFFEDYINKLPSPKDRNTKTVVIDVDLYKVTDDIFGYNFITTKEYQGITFDHMKSGTQHSQFNDYSTCGGNAFMVESDDVDILYGYYQLQSIENETLYKDIVPLESIAKTVSEKLTDNVVFEVQKIELVYTEKPGKNEDGLIDIENPSSEVIPAWKFTLYNANDKFTYVCYVDAVDGGNFRYYTTPDN